MSNSLWPHEPSLVPAARPALAGGGLLLCWEPCCRVRPRSANGIEHLEVHGSCIAEPWLGEFSALQLCGSLSILWHCLSLGLEWKLTFSSPVATDKFSKFAGILSAALSGHHLLGFEIVSWNSIASTSFVHSDLLNTMFLPTLLSECTDSLWYLMLHCFW